MHGVSLSNSVGGKREREGRERERGKREREREKRERARERLGDRQRAFGML